MSSPRFASSGDSSAVSAAPWATAKCASSSAVKLCPGPSSLRMKLSRRPFRKESGPPRKTIFPRIGRPQARPEIVCSATASKTLRAASERGTPLFKSATRSVFAKTPHREAIGCETVAESASSSSPAASVERSAAIWSMKAPVPPAQLPFIRSSSPPLRKMILASSPPSSMTASVSGSYSITVL